MLYVEVLGSTALREGCKLVNDIGQMAYRSQVTICSGQY